MGFKILLCFILIVYAITITYNSNSNKDFTAPLISQKNLNSGLTLKEFYKLVRRKRRCTIKRPYNNTTAVVFLRLLLLLSGDVELNPGPWTCARCNQKFRHQGKYENHLVNQQLVYLSRRFWSRIWVSEIYGSTVNHLLQLNGPTVNH